MTALRDRAEDSSGHRRFARVEPSCPTRGRSRAAVAASIAALTAAALPGVSTAQNATPPGPVVQGQPVPPPGGWTSGATTAPPIQVQGADGQQWTAVRQANGTILIIQNPTAQGPSGAGDIGSTRPIRLEYQPGDVVPRGYLPRDRPDQGLLIGGLTTFAVSYGVSFISGVILGSDSNDSGALALLVPLAGPFITIGTSQTRGAGTFGLAVDGIVQITGATLFFASLGIRNHYLLRVASEPTFVDVQAGPGGGAVRWTF